MSSSQSEHTLGGGWGAVPKRTRVNKGGGAGGQNPGILSERSFWMPPFMNDVDVETTPYSVNLVVSELGKLSSL